jgi:hypothetical protein
MTSRGLQRKPPARRRGWPLANVAVAFIMCLAVLAGIQAPKAAQTERLVVNPASGLAISGYDPVAYFTQNAAVLGRPELELTRNGTVWRFLNEGNRAAFEANPEVYTPQFGGYDPVAIDREASVPGHPQIWAVAGERLYLFYNEGARTAFLGNPGRVVDSARRKWPDVSRTIGQ